MPHDYEWMLFSGVVRDAVTSYEVYLTGAIDELLSYHGQQRLNAERSPNWPKFHELYGLLGLDPQPPGVKHIVGLRDVLTHHRGALRTEELRATYAQDDGIYGDVAHLDAATVTAHLDTLGKVAREVDSVVWAYRWKRLDRLPPGHLLMPKLTEKVPQGARTRPASFAISPKPTGAEIE